MKKAVPAFLGFLFIAIIVGGMAGLVFAEADLPGGAGEGSEKFICYKNFFTVNIPTSWEKYEEILAADEEKVYGVDLKGPQNQEGAFTSISVQYYGPDHLMFQFAEKFIEANSKVRIAEGEKVGPLTTATLAGRPARQFDRNVFLLIPPHAVTPKQIPMFERLIVLPGLKGGFYVLQYSSPEDLSKQYMEIFEKVVASFKPNA